MRDYSSSDTGRDMTAKAIEDSDIISGLEVRYLKYFGLWKAINDYRTTGKRNVVVKLSVFITFILATPYIVFQCMSYFYIKVDLQKFTFLNLNILVPLQLGCRVLVFWIRIDSQCRLVNLMKKDFLVIPFKKQKSFDRFYREISRTINLFCGIYVILTFSVAVFYVSDPDTPVDYILKHTGNMYDVTTGRKKLYGGWYPVPMDESPFFEIIFVYEVICTIWAMVLMGSYLCMYFQVLLCLYAQFLALGYHIKTFDFGQENNKILLRNLLKDHQKLLRYSEELRSVYNPLVTLTLGIGVVVLIVGSMQSIMGKTLNPVFLFKMTVVILYQGAELSMFCYGSSFIETASSDLQFAAYSSEWYKASITMRKALLIMMTRARNSSGLTALRMYPVNRETLMSVLQFTYSTSTLMSRMTE